MPSSNPVKHFIYSFTQIEYIGVLTSVHLSNKYVRMQKNIYDIPIVPLQKYYARVYKI